MCIVAELVGTDGPEVFKTLAWYCATVIVGILVHVGLLIAAAKFIGRCSPMRLWRGLRDALMIAFTTRSSAATLPVTMRCVEEKLGVSPRIGNFALPVGATMNMDGTALYEGVAVIFLLQIYTGMVDVPFSELTFAVIFVIFVTAVMASVGAAAVPDAGLVTMVLVADAIGLPVYYIPLIFAVDAFLDMFRTTTNVLGDSVGCLVVQRLEGEPLPPEAALA
jgi:solute carrier family 1 (high affinity glutamate transporter) protein 1/solute carrier family 1 (high affinity glutamate transporter) protein 3